MKLDQVVQDLVRDEGFRPKAYRDSLGKLTIGIGFLIDPSEPGAEPMPREVADLWLRIILTRRAEELNVAVPFWTRLTDRRRSALLNMSFQLGTGGLLKFRNMLKSLEMGKYADARREALNSLWAKQTPQRAERIAAMLGPDG